MPASCALASCLTLRSTSKHTSRVRGLTCRSVNTIHLLMPCHRLPAGTRARGPRCGEMVAAAPFDTCCGCDEGSTLTGLVAVFRAAWIGANGT